MVVFRVHTLPTTCLTSLSTFIVTVSRKTVIIHRLSANVAVSVCARFFVSSFVVKS